MYNRYIPQPDGSFLRSSVPESASITPEEKPSAAEPADEKPSGKGSQKIRKSPMPNGRFRSNAMQSQPISRRTIHRDPVNGSISGFFKGLIPENLDAEDLIVILLLLLMSGSSSENPNIPLLTLGIYLFL